MTVKLIVSVPVAWVACVGASYLIAKLLLALNNDFGAGDLSAFLFWTAQFAVALLLPAVLFAVFMRNVRMINRIWIGVLLGGVAGFGWTLFNRVMLGPWFGAWSFNVLYCWVGGGALGILAVALLNSTSMRRVYNG